MPLFTIANTDPVLIGSGRTISVTNTVGQNVRLLSTPNNSEPDAALVRSSGAQLASGSSTTFTAAFAPIWVWAITETVGNFTPSTLDVTTVDWAANTPGLTQVPLPNQNVHQLALAFTAAPTGGTWALTTGILNASSGAAITVTGQAWNVTAATLRDNIQTALNTPAPGWRVSVIGGPFPIRPYIVTYVHSTGAAAGIPTADVSGLTGGTGVTFARSQVVSQVGTGRSGISMLGPRAKITKDFQSDSGGTQSTDNGWSIDGTGATRFTATATGNNIAAVTRFNGPVDLSRGPLVVQVYNPQDALVAGLLTLWTSHPTSPGGTTQDISVTLEPGPSQLVVDESRLGNGGVDYRVTNAVSAVANAYTGEGYWNATGLAGLTVSDIRVPDTDRPGLVCFTWDDCLISLLDNGINSGLLAEYPDIPHTLYAVHSWMRSGARSIGVGADSAQVMTQAQMQSVVRSPQFAIGNHSRNHYRYEAQEDPLSTATTATDQIIRTGTTAPGGGTFTLTIPGVGTTGNLAWNATTKVIQAALNSLVANTRVVLYSGTSNNLGSQYSFRVIFPTARPIMTVDSTNLTAGGATIVSGAAFTPARIAEEYRTNAELLREAGFTVRNDLIVYPQGSVGPNVMAAMETVPGVRAGRVDRARAGHRTFYGAAALYGSGNERAKYLLPTSILGTTGTQTANNLDDIMRVSTRGGNLIFMGHGVVTSGGGSVDILNTDLRQVLSLVSQMIRAGRLRAVWPWEMLDAAGIPAATTPA
jgi:hypothetical protein